MQFNDILAKFLIWRIKNVRTSNFVIFLSAIIGALAGLAAVYLGLRWVLKADHSEGLVGLFSFAMMSLVILTITGVFFRGANMALVLPF